MVRASSPVGRVEHIGGDAEAIQIVEQFVSGLALTRQPLPRQGHARPVARHSRHQQSGARDLVGNAQTIQTRRDFAGGLRVEPGIQRCEIRPGRGNGKESDHRNGCSHAEAERYKAPGSKLLQIFDEPFHAHSNRLLARLATG